MKLKTALSIFLFGCLTGSGLTWFWLEKPQVRDELIESAREKIREVTGAGSDDPTADAFPPGVSRGHAYGGLPVDVGYPGDLRILENTGFVVGYCEVRNNPAWVSYRVFRADRLQADTRPSRFLEDSRTQSRIDHDGYTHSGFDRGHMAPNFAIATRYGREAQLETFLMSNIVPQDPDLNQGPWRVLEEMISGYAQRYDEVWVVTGPLYDHSATFIGPKIEVPDAFFKIVVDETGAGVRILAFSFPQDVRRKDDPRRFLTTVDAIEALSGFDFFSELPDEIEDRLEAMRASRPWEN